MGSSTTLVLIAVSKEHAVGFPGITLQSSHRSLCFQLCQTSEFFLSSLICPGDILRVCLILLARKGRSGVGEERHQAHRLRCHRQRQGHSSESQRDVSLAKFAILILRHWNRSSLGNVPKLLMRHRWKAGTWLFDLNLDFQKWWPNETILGHFRSRRGISMLTIVWQSEEGLRREVCKLTTSDRWVQFQLYCGS